MRVAGFDGLLLYLENKVCDLPSNIPSPADIPTDGLHY